uniref:Uncharacterized protein n=1 Tax=Cannabis sativa TaxID=3483 RepID=A0A803RAZ9_CANSA
MIIFCTIIEISLFPNRLQNSKPIQQLFRTRHQCHNHSLAVRRKVKTRLIQTRSKLEALFNSKTLSHYN